MSIPGLPTLSRRPITVEVVSGEHANDAGHSEGGGGVDALNLCMGVGTADDGQMQHPRELDVGSEEALTAQESIVLGAENALASVGCVSLLHRLLPA